LDLRSLFNSLAALCTLICLSACDLAGSRQGDIYLPEGDPGKGEMYFVSLGCVNCHAVIGSELPEPAEAGSVRVLLGSQIGRELSHGELVTSIVNPSHRLSARYRKDEVSEGGESLMTSYNDVLTVTQLTDLVAFLDAHYKTADRPDYEYRAYPRRGPLRDQTDGDSEDANPQ
jgi:hypothetical protein